MQKHKNKIQKKQKTTKKRVRGGCGCNKPLFGGSTGLQELSPEYYYPKNTYMNDPSNLPNIHSARFTNGGKRTKKRKQKKNRGGSLFSNFNSINPINPTIQSSNSNLLYQQPIMSKFGPHNSYLV